MTNKLYQYRASFSTYHEEQGSLLDTTWNDVQYTYHIRADNMDEAKKKGDKVFSTLNPNEPVDVSVQEMSDIGKLIGSAKFYQ